MDMDTITLYLKSVTDKMTNNLKNAIQTWQQYDNVTSKVANGMKNVTNATNTVNSNFSSSKEKVAELKKEIEDLTTEYDRQAKAFSQRSGGMSAIPYNPTKDLGKGEVGDPNAGIVLTQEKLDRQKELIDELQSKYNEMVGDVERPIDTPNLVPKTENTTKKFEDVGKKAEDTSKKVSRLGNVMRSLGVISKNISSKGIDLLKNKFNIFSKDLGKGVEKNVFTIKKLALGLIGVRTTMAMLTKSVNAYLSFDSELQDSLTNSWNMLGSLLAPAIELVARMFALATNYIAQFVSALTGIDLVARANARALDTQAKATKKASNAQRGLLSMDEITNLPTESASSPANQIKIDDTIKSFKLLDDILAHLKEGKWHEVGEDIASGIDKLLGSIKWNDIKKRAYDLGYNFADFLNGLFEVNWSQIGNTIAQTWNTFVELVRGFVEKFSFIRFGMGIGNMFNNMILNTDWNAVATTINKTIQGLGDSISTFLKTFKWGEIGEAFGDFVTSIDWGNILFEAFKVSVLAISGISEFLISFFDTVFDRLTTEISKWVKDSFRSLKFDVKDFNSWLERVGLTLGNVIKNIFVSTLNSMITKINRVISPFRALIVTFGKVTGQNWSMENIKIPYVSLAVGTPYIESEGLYHLHEGEMVTPKRYNPNANGYDSGSDNRQIIDLLISLNSSMLQYAERPVEINMNGKLVAEGIYDNMQEIDKNRNKSSVMVRS